MKMYNFYHLNQDEEVDNDLQYYGSYISANKLEKWTKVQETLTGCRFTLIITIPALLTME